MNNHVKRVTKDVLCILHKNTYLKQTGFHT